MTVLHLLQRIFALLSLALPAVGGWLVWRYFDLADNGVAGDELDRRWLYLGAALLAWSFVEPVLRLDVWLSPLVRLMNWQSYLSGSTHVAMRVAGFARRPTRAQLDQVARLATPNSPAVQAKGNLAMMRWDASAILPRVATPPWCSPATATSSPCPGPGSTSPRSFARAGSSACPAPATWARSRRRTSTTGRCWPSPTPPSPEAPSGRIGTGRGRGIPVGPGSSGPWRGGRPRAPALAARIGAAAAKKLHTRRMFTAVRILWVGV